MGFGDLPLRTLTKITDVDGVLRTLGDEAQNVKVTLREGATADDFEIMLKDQDQVYLNRYVEGCKTEIWIDKSNPPTTKRLTGIIEKHRISETQYGRDILVLTGTDYVSERMKNILVSESYRNMEVSLIVKDLFAKYLPTVTTNNVQTTTVVIPDIRFPRRFLSQAIGTLAGICGYNYFGDETLDFHFYPKGQTSSGLTLSPEHIVDVPYEEGDVTPIKNIILFAGGVALVIDQQQETHATYLSMHDYYRAVPFTPVQTDLKQIGLYLSKVGAPENLQGEIREDKDNTPLGRSVKSFEYSKNFIGSAGWYPLGIDESIRSEKKHWIVLKKIGAVDSTYRWYHDDGTGGENAYSLDDVTWTRQTSSFAFAYRTYWGVRILAQAENPVSTQKYKERMYFHHDDAVLSRETARKIARGLADSMGEKRRAISFTVLTPDIIPQVGMLVSVNYPRLGISNEALTLREVIFNVSPHLQTYSVEMGFERELESAADVIADVLGNIKALEAKLSGIDETTLLDIYHLFEESLVLSDVLTRRIHRTLAETLGLSDVLICTEHASGTFVTGTARTGFSETG